MMYFIFGADTYGSKQKLNDLIKQYQDGLEVQKIEGNKISVDELKSKFNSQSMFDNKKFLIIENATQNKEQAELSAFLKSAQPSKDDVIIFFESKVDKRTTLFKFLNTLKDKFEFEELKGVQLERWVEKYVTEKRGSIEKVAVSKLLFGTNSDLWFLSLELDKLLAYDKKITLESVELLTASGFDDNIFSLSDAIGVGNKVKAIELLNKQLEAGAEPLYLLAMIVRQFRILIQVKEALSKEKFPNYSLLAKELKLHPFVVQKTASQVNKFSFQDLENKYNKLEMLDLQLKSSKLSAECLFSQFIFS